jgi:hypothetical protein
MLQVQANADVWWHEMPLVVWFSFFSVQHTASKFTFSHDTKKKTLFSVLAVVDVNIQLSTNQLKHQRQHSTPCLRVPTANELNVMWCNSFFATTQCSLSKNQDAFPFHTNHECSLRIKSNLLQFYQTPNLQTAAEHMLEFPVNGPTPRLSKRPKPWADNCSVSLQRLMNSMNHEASEPWGERKIV